MLLSFISNQRKQNWKSIAELMDNKYTPSQCSQHYNRVIQPSLLKKAKWDDEECEQLMEMYSIYGNRWSQISEFMYGRSDIQCRRILSIIYRAILVHKQKTQKT
jgi:hypothetical protein